MADIILASSSASRKILLATIGMPFYTAAADIDERAVEAQASLADAGQAAMVLAKAKACHIAKIYPGAVVIGADQTLALANEMLHKSSNKIAAAQQIIKMSGHTHVLYSAVSIVTDGKVLDSFTEKALMTVRKLDQAAVDQYVVMAAENNMLSSVGGYHFEGAGISLFSSVVGSQSTILGLPLQKIRSSLRKLNLIR